MENAILILEDRITLLTGKMARIEDEDITELAKTVIIKGWEKEIEELTEAQRILSES